MKRSALPFAAFLVVGLSSVAQASDTIGTVIGNTVVQVAPGPAVQAFVCTPAWRADTCWPNIAGSSTTAPVSSLAPTAHVWASIAGAAPRWVPLSSVGMPSVVPPANPSPPPVGLGPGIVYWTAPTLDSAGQPLTDLTGFKVYIGTASGKYAAPVLLPVATLTYDLSVLAPGTYYVAVTAVSASLGESASLAEVSEVIGAPAAAQILRCTSGAPAVTGMQATATVTCTYGP